MSAVIEVSGIHNQFGRQVVHHNLDLSIHAGEIVAIVGGSGTGKSVLLRTIVGLNQPQAGQVKLFGHDYLPMSGTERTAIEQRFGILFQRGALFSSLTVAENIALPLIEHRGLSKAQAEKLALLKLGLVGLPANAMDKYPSNLSGGMVKRVALARSLALEPEIIFLDEPTAGLDPIGAADFDQLILTLRDALGLTVVLITHDLDSLYTITDKVAVLSQQRVIINQPIEQVAAVDDPWIQAYFHGPRGRAAQQAQARLN